MKKSLLIFIIPFVFVACGEKNSALRFFDKSENEINAIKNTKKSDIVLRNEVEIIFMATHLNKVDEKIEDSEDIFLVYTYFTALEEQDYRKNGYEVLLNGQTPKSVELLDKDGKKYDEFMLKNSWGQYFLISFDNKGEVSKLKLVLKPKTTEAVLNFEK
ncbi:hypothetical protein [Aliarcobacter skirrowii]|uniref:hypothetical protein n=1 Tax=Aliarcobacter skirrowii TaxID=28200 RepID=UPI0029A5E69B|nr:hypothetical protein [Aliarcobacter skirrowii]MDX4040228.1 hypothetical protein [Aliarcobacter skirrowii]